MPLGGSSAYGGNLLGGTASAQQTPPQMPRPQRPMDPNSQMGQFKQKGLQGGQRGLRRPRARQQADALSQQGRPPQQVTDALINMLGFDVNDPMLRLNPRTGRRV